MSSIKAAFGWIWLLLALLHYLAIGMVWAETKEIPPPPRVREASKELYGQFQAFVKFRVDSIDEQNPVRYDFLDATYVQTEKALLIGDAWREWGDWLQGQVLDSVKLLDSQDEFRLLLPAYKITRGPKRHEKRIHKKVKSGRDVYLAINRHADGYWLAKKALNRHDFAELKKIGERIALTGRDDTIGVKGSSFRLHMNPLQKAYYAAANQVREGEMTQEELEQQFTPEMIQEVYDPENAELVLGRK